MITSEKTMSHEELLGKYGHIRDVHLILLP